MPEYVILPIENPSTFEDMSPQEMQRVVERYTKWTRALAKAERLMEGHKLADGTGRVLEGTGPKRTVTDRPHTESKELIGGFWIIRAEGYDEAERLCNDCPHLEFGPLVIREIEGP
jgi:hypothetical protein